jgi:uncharacterized delta-60 repeat protein
MKVLPVFLTMLMAVILGCAGGCVISKSSAGGGDLLWAKSSAGSDSEECYGITALSDDSIVVIGNFFGSATFGPDEANLTQFNESEIFIARYNPDGSLLWAKQAGGALYQSASGVTALSDDSIVVAGGFDGGTITFSEGENSQKILTSAGSCDIFITQYNPDGSLAWAKRIGGTYTDYAFGVTALSDDSTVVAGSIGSTVTFGEGEPNQTALNPSGNVGDLDIFIARYNPDGTLAWAKKASGEFSNHGYAIAGLPDNSSVIIGLFKDTATFGEGESNQTELTSEGKGIDQTVLISPGKDDMFIARYNPDGTLAWAKRAGGSPLCEGWAVAGLSDNSTVVTGKFEGSATFGKGEPNQTVLTSEGKDDIFIARYNPDGTLAWAKRAGGSSSDAGSGVTALPDNSIVVTGWFESRANFSEGESNRIVLTSAGSQDIFIACYNPDATVAWARSIGGSGFEAGSGATTLSDNSIVVAGPFTETVIFGRGETNETQLVSTSMQNIFIARFGP